MSPRVDDVNNWPDHDILVRLYQAFIDHLKEGEAEKTEVRAALDNHEERIQVLEYCKIESTAKGNMLSSACKHPVTLVLLGVLISFGSWAGYKLLCHLFGARL